MGHQHPLPCRGPSPPAAPPEETHPMEDLFRFLLVRPASPTAATTVLRLAPSFVAANATRDVARQAALAFIAQNPPATATAGFVWASLARDVAAFVGDDGAALKDVVSLVKKENNNH